MGPALKRGNQRAIARTASAGALAALLATAAPFSAISQQGGSVVNQPNQIPNELMVKFAAGISPQQARETIQRTGAQIVGEPVLEGRLFHVRTADSTALATVKGTLRGAPGVEYVENVQGVSIPTPPQ
jgi:hypothetical protein